jgi:hypothetical protein
MKFKRFIPYIGIPLSTAAIALVVLKYLFVIDANEWGVIVDVGESNQYREFVIDPNSPQDNAISSYEHDSLKYLDSCCSVREPVLYIYSKIPIHMTIGIDFHSGLAALTYPRARYINRNRFEWQIRISPISHTNLRIPQEYIRMQNFDASTIYSGNDTSSFLFYEGSTPIRLPLNVTLNERLDSVYVYNPNAFTALDVCVSIKPDY